MEEKRIEVTKERLASKIEEYVKIIISEYKDYIPKEQYDFLININNFRDFVHIEDIGTISLFVKNNHFYFPTSAYKIIDVLTKIPGYGSNKKHTPYTKDKLIDNDNTFSDYIKHIFLSGASVEQYYLELLLHETMHFCGSNGGSALMEGINELKTRELASKYNLLTNGCGYPKEVKIALQLEELLGLDVINKLAFSKSNVDKLVILSTISEDAVKLFFEVEEMMEIEFQEKYYKYNFPGITGPIKKTIKYREIDYTKVQEKIYEYQKKYKQR